MKVLITYFSVTNNTHKLAQQIKEHLDSFDLFDKIDLFRIEPNKYYPNDDYERLDNIVKNEQELTTFIPLKNNIPDLTQYDMIYLGFPIWYKTFPRVMYTVLNELKKLDKNVNIIPFCTNAENKFASSDIYLKAFLRDKPNLTVLDGICNKINY